MAGVVSYRNLPLSGQFRDSSCILRACDGPRTFATLTGNLGRTLRFRCLGALDPRTSRRPEWQTVRVSYTRPARASPRDDRQWYLPKTGREIEIKMLITFLTFYSID